MNPEQAQQSLKDAITTLLKTPPIYWHIKEEFDGDDFATVGYPIGTLVASGSEVQATFSQCITIADSGLFDEVWMVARKAKESHDPATAHFTTSTAAIRRYLKTL